MMSRIVTLFAVLGTSLCRDMAARFDVAGFKGSVVFSGMYSEVTVTLTFANIPSASHASQYDTIELWSLPAVFGRMKTASQVCRSGLGVKLRDLVFGRHSGKVRNIVPADYYHRSVAVRSSLNATLPILCGTVLPEASDLSTYRVKFTGPVFGSVWLRYDDTDGVYVYGDLVESNPESASVVRSLFSITSETAGAQFELISRSLRIPNTTTKTNTFGFMSESAMTSLSGKMLAVLDGNAIVACALFHLVPRKSVTSYMNWAGVKGTFRFSQNSPFDATETAVDLEGLGGRAKGYHVHNYPVPQRLDVRENPCAASYVGGHFNPYAVNPAESPGPGKGSSDQYEIGDLSGKYGTLAGKDGLSRTYTDWNLPLFGRNSIVGRSIVIHNDDEGSSRLMCSTIGFPREVTTAVAVFKSPAYGKMYIRQESGDPESDTMVFMELASTRKAESSSHNWHIHEYPADDDAYSGEGRCLSTGAHFNPTQVSLEEPYATECSEANPFRCELGDLSGRLGRIDIATTRPSDAGKFFFTDEYLPLTGPNSIIGRSVTVHAANGAAARFACANITRLHPIVVATSGDWVGSKDGASASITLKQASEFDVTEVSGKFRALGYLAGGYHIHEFPIPGDGPTGSECSAQSVAGHWIPFNWDVSQSPPAGTGTCDWYEVGDLSGKFGLLDSQAAHEIPVGTLDTNLPLHSSLSALGRSVVIHKKRNNERWKCANLYESVPSGGHVISATVTFHKLVTGTVKLRQIVYEDGGAGLTSLEVEVAPRRWQKTLQHNWHIHSQPIDDQSECAEAAGHYDPYDAISNADYATDCHPENPLYCEVGDLSNKQSRYDIGGGRKLFRDVDTPLHTNYTVLGRSIVFHNERGAASRFTCANIVPDDFTYTFAFPATTAFTRYSFIDKIAGSLGISRMRVVIVHNLNVPFVMDGCSKVMVTIAGGESLNELQIEQLSSGSLPGLGEYASTSWCVTMSGANVIGQRSR